MPDSKSSSIKKAIVRLERSIKGISYFAQQRREQQIVKLKAELAATIKT